MKKNYSLNSVLLSALFVLGSFTGFSQTPLDSALIACYPFTGNANDVSGNGNNGIVNGATLVADRFGNANSAYSFNGTSSEIKVSNFESKVAVNQFSISFWAKGNVIKSQSPFILISDVTTSRFNIHIYYLHSDNNAWTFFDYGNVSSSGRLAYQGSPLPTGNNWDHFVFVYDHTGNTMKYYKNGTLISSKSGTSAFTATGQTRDLYIGGAAATAGGDLHYSGLLDDVKIYHRALSANDVTALYTGSYTCPSTAGISEEAYEKIDLFPNPATNELNVNGLEFTDYSIINAFGQVIATSKNDPSNGTTKIALPKMSNGVYFLHLRSRDKIRLAKFIIQN